MEKRRRCTCREMESVLADFLEGSLTGIALEAVESHLRSCPGCEQIYSLAARLGEEGKSDQVPDPGPAYWNRFLPRIEARIGRMEPARGRIPLWAPAFALALIVAMGLGLWWNSRNDGAADLEERLDTLLDSFNRDADLAVLLEDLLPGSSSLAIPRDMAGEAGNRSREWAEKAGTLLEDLFASDPVVFLVPRIELQPEEVRSLIRDLRSSPEMRPGGSTS